MSSAGQIVGGIIGGAIGVAFPVVGFALGASIGMAVGGLIDPPKGPDSVGPRLSDLSVQTSTYGVPIGHAYGTVPVLGNIFWLEGDQLREVETSESVGGKGGASSTVTTFTYLATFAVGLFVVRDPAQTIRLRRLWVGSTLMWDATAASVGSIIAINTEGINFTFYDGRDPQAANPRMQADKGVADVSGYPGLCYIVIEDLDLTKFSNSLELAQVKAEVVVGGAATPEVIYAATAHYPSPIPFGGQRYVMPPSLHFTPTEITHSVCTDNNLSGHIGGVVFGKTTLGINQDPVSETALDLPGSGFNQLASAPIPAYWSDRPVFVIMVNLYGADHPQQLAVMESSGTVSYSVEGFYGIPFGNYCVVQENDVFILGKENNVLPVYLFSGGNLTATSTPGYKVSGAGVSENYLFVVEYSISATTTIYKLDRTTLALVDTFSETTEGAAHVIYVESDTKFWTAASSGVTGYSNLYLWDGGAVTGVFYDALPTPNLEKFEVYDGDELFVVSATSNLITEITDYYVTTLLTDAAVAKLHDIVTAECVFAGISSSDIDLSSLVNRDVRGFRVTQGSARAALEQLQPIFTFDATVSGYKLKFVSRGGASVATVPESDLVASSEDKGSVVLLPIAREMDSQIPATVSVKYLDPDREYDLGEQFAARPATSSVSSRTVETTVVLNTAEAAQAADILNQKDWVERRDYGPFELPPTYRAIEPCDVVTVQHRGANHVLRIMHVEYLPDGRLSCTGRITAPQSYTSTATGAAPLVTGLDSVPLRGPTECYFLDIPRLHENQDVSSLAFGLLGLSSGWPGGSLFRTDDNGNSYFSVGSNNNPVSVFVSGDPPEADGGYTIDHASVINVTPRTPGATLYSTTVDELFSEKNLAAYGVDGRWEIIAFDTVVDQSGSYDISGLIRGLYGTEWATGLHEAADWFIILDTIAVSLAEMPSSLFGIPINYRPVTTGVSLDSVADISFTYGAVNLKPLTPVNLRGFRDLPSQDWVFEWDARSRSSVGVFSGYPVPVSETPEQYNVKIMDGSTVVRSLAAVSSPTARYAVADQIADFGIKPENITVAVAKVSPICGAGFWAERQVSHYLNIDDLFDDVVLLLHFEGANGGTTFTDVIGHTVTSVNATTQTTAPLMGGASGYFNGSTAYLYIQSASDLNLGSADFCLEASLNISSASPTQKIAGIWSDTSGSGFSYKLYVSGGKLGFYWSTTGLNYFTVLSSAGAITANTLQRVAAFRLSNVLYLTVEGSVVYSGVFTDTIYAVNTSKYFEIGRDGAGNTEYLGGLVDEVRLTKNARYTGAYTPSSNQFPDG